jgi:hypothetical protein
MIVFLKCKQRVPRFVKGPERDSVVYCLPCISYYTTVPTDVRSELKLHDEIGIKAFYMIIQVR